MNAFFKSVTIALALLLASPAAAERVVIRVSIADQKMQVFHEGRRLFEWPVSTAKPGKITPRGTFTPEFLSRDHKSRRYNNAPMPWAIFYDGHYAVHGTDQIKRLGQPASRGCVRLHPDHAKLLFKMVKAEGMKNTRVVITQ